MAISRYHYRTFGLNVVSEYELPELLAIPPSEEWDIRILVGSTPPILPDAVVSEPWIQMAPQSLLLHIPKAGDFWVHNGNTITLQPLPDTPPEQVRLFLLGSAFGALLHQRGILPIHGSGLIYRDKAFIITGIAGAGKSTLAAALVKKGCRLLADDVAAIAFTPDGNPWIQPAYPQQKLWRDSVVAMRLPAGRLLRMIEGEEKYALSATECYYRNPKTVAAVFELLKPEEGTVAEVGMSPVLGMEKISIINANVYRPFFAKGLGLQSELLKRCFHLAGRVKAARIYRTQKLGDLEKLSMAVMHALAGL